MNYKIKENKLLHGKQFMLCLTFKDPADKLLQSFCAHLSHSCSILLLLKPAPLCHSHKVQNAGICKASSAALFTPEVFKCLLNPPSCCAAGFPLSPRSTTMTMHPGMGGALSRAFLCRQYRSIKYLLNSLSLPHYSHTTLKWNWEAFKCLPNPLLSPCHGPAKI